MGPGAPCPDNPPPPPGLKVMQGIAHPDLQAWASSLVHDPTTTFGQIFETVFGDKSITARVEHHSWTTHGAQVIPGCYKGVTLYEHKHTDAAAGAEDAEPEPPEDTLFFPLGGGQWAGFPSGDTLDNEDLPYEPKDPNVAVASGVSLQVPRSATADCASQPWAFPPDFCKCVLAGGGRNCEPLLYPAPGGGASTGCCGADPSLMSPPDGRQPRALLFRTLPGGAGLLKAAVGAALTKLPGVTTVDLEGKPMLLVTAPPDAWTLILSAAGPLAPYRGLVDVAPDVSFSAPAYATGQLVDIPAPPSPFMPYGEPPITRDEAFAAASQLSSMFPNIRAIVAQAPDGFYVRVITLGGALRGGGGGLGFGGLGNLFGDKGLKRQPAGRGSDWGDVFRAMDRLPSQIGRVRVQIDRLVSSDFAVGGEPGENIPIDEARAAQDQLRADLIDRCKCVLNWMRGVGLDCVQEKCGPGSKSKCSVILLVDGTKMSAEALEMVPPLVGRVPVRVRDIGSGPVPRFMEIVAP